MPTATSSRKAPTGAIWILRITVAAALLLHVWAAFSLISRSNQARPQSYAGGFERKRSDYASITMRYGGPALLLFVLYHLTHLTLGWTHPSFVYGDVYNNMVHGFSDPVVAGVYIVAMLALGLHLYHGIRSGLQTVGLASLESKWPAQLGAFIALVVMGGNLSFPISVLAGFIKEAP